MTPIFPKAAPPNSHFAMFGVNQPDVDPLPAAVAPGGVVLTEWVPSEAERRHLATGGHLLLWIWTCDQPLQPVAVETDSVLPAGVNPHSAVQAEQRGTGSVHDAVMILGSDVPDGRAR